MKQTTRLIFAAIAVCGAATTSFSAEKKGKRPSAPPQADPAAVSAIKPFDKDGNFEIDLKEFPAMQAAFNASPTGKLKQFDKGGDNKLDDTVDRAAINMELAASKMAANRDDDGAKKRKKKK